MQDQEYIDQEIGKIYEKLELQMSEALAKFDDQIEDLKKRVDKTDKMFIAIYRVLAEL